LYSLAALAVSADGKVALVSPDGETWIAAAGGAGGTSWQALPPLSRDARLAGEVLGAAWGTSPETLFLTVADVAAGTPRLLVVARPVDGSPERYFELPLVPDGPGLAVLPDGRLVLVARDEMGRSRLALVETSGAFTILGVRARGVAIGGDLVAVTPDLEEVLIGDATALARGVAPAEPLPLDGDLGVDSIAIAPDGSATAVLRLDADLAPVRVDVHARRGGTWASLGQIPVAPGPGGVTIAWLTAP
jgi:hypothetical protein